MDLIEEIRATQNHYMSKHAAQKIVEVFAAWVDDRRNSVYVMADYGIDEELDCMADDLRSMLSTSPHTE